MTETKSEELNRDLNSLLYKGTSPIRNMGSMLFWMCILLFSHFVFVLWKSLWDTLFPSCCRKHVSVNSAFYYCHKNTTVITYANFLVWF